MIEWDKLELRLALWLTCISLFLIFGVLICYATGFLVVHVVVDNASDLRPDAVATLQP